MADFLTEKRSEIDRRLKELKPLHEEYLRLEQAVSALESVDGSRQRGPGRPRGGSRRAATRRRRRGHRGATRAQQALELVRKNPGITVSELGTELGIAQKNYLYRVMAGLQSDGSVRKQGRGFTAA